MKKQDLGFDPKTGIHNRNLTHWESKFLAILWEGDHFGKGNPIPADELAVRIDCAVTGEKCSDNTIAQILRAHRNKAIKQVEIRKREVRDAQNHLLDWHYNIPAYSRAGTGGGYYIGETVEEGDEFFETFRKRGLTGLRKGSRGKKSIMKKRMVQLLFDFEEMLEDTANIPVVPGRAYQPELVDVADSLIEQMLLHPEKYGDGLRRIGTKYSSVFLPKADAQTIKIKAEELLDAVNRISI